MKRGDKFKHKIWTDTNNNPLLCVVTKTVNERVYWKEIGTIKSKDFFYEDEFNKYVLCIIDGIEVEEALTTI